MESFVLVFLEKQLQHLQYLSNALIFCFVLIKSSFNFNMNCKPNQLAQGVSIVMPKSVIRTISLQKLKQIKPLQQQNQNIFKAKPQNNDKEKIYDKILGRKLSTKIQKEMSIEKQINPIIVLNKKMEQLRQEVVQNQMKECTFKPQINPSKKDNRTTEQFFNEQIQYNKKKNEKIQQMRIILETNRQKQNIFRPNAFLNANANLLQKGQVYQRLYQDSKNKQKNSSIHRQESVETIKNNSITKSKRFKGISRAPSAQKFLKKDSQDHPIQTIQSKQFQNSKMISEQENVFSQGITELESLTSRKQSIESNNNIRPIQQSKGHRQNKSKQICRRVDVNILQKKDNSKNEQIYIAKLMKQIKIVIEKCNLSPVFSYMEMNLFFQKMNFITSQSLINSRKHIYEIWNMLQGQIFKEVSAISIIKIVYAIMGCHNVSLVNKQINQTWFSDASYINFKERQLLQMGKKMAFKHNILMINERDSKKIKQSNEQLFLNRLKLGQSELLKQDKNLQFSFKPTISKASNQLAEKYRNRVLCQSQKLIAQNKIDFSVPSNGQIDHPALLLLDEKRKEALLQMKRDQAERQRKRIENQSLNLVSERESNASSNSNRNRNHQLYEMGKHNNLYKKDKSSDQIELEKWQHELTFKPNIKPKTNFVESLISQDIPDYDKAVYRMLGARKMKKNTNSSVLDSSPLLYLNVVMEGCQSVKVPVFKNDNLKSITEKVRVMLELENEGGSKKLERILKLQILPALKQMGLQNLIGE